MKRRDALKLIGGTAAAATVFRPNVRALAQSGAAGATLTYGQSTAVLTLDPAHGAFTGYPGGYEVALCLYDRLLDFDAEMTIRPQLAESFAMADDLMSATVTLRPGAVFHDGTAVDAAAVAFNIERMMDAERNPTNRPLWNPVAGADIVDDLTVVIRLNTPFSQLPNTLAHGSGAIVSPAAVEQHGEEGIAQNPMGAGPFRLASFDPGQEVVLEAFADYWGGAPATSQLTFRAITEPATRVAALQTGAVDVVDSVPVALVGQLSSAADIEVVSKPGLRPIGFALNLTREPLQDERVRQALNHAVPVELIAERVFFGFAKAPNSPLAFNTVGYAPVSELTHDPDAAKALLDEAGHGGDNPLRLTMYAPEGLFPGDVSVAEIVAESLSQVGVAVEITKVEGGAYWDALRQDPANLGWDMAMFGFNPSNASGLYHLSSLFKSNADDSQRPDVWNICRYSNPDVDRLLEQADASADAAEQAAALAEVQQIVWNDNPYLWLQVNENISAHRSGLSGVEVWPIVFTVVRDAAAT